MRFAPGAHTAWHAHANGQTLHVTDGRGMVQASGGVVIEIRPGDTFTRPTNGTGALFHLVISQSAVVKWRESAVCLRGDAHGRKPPWLYSEDVPLTYEEIGKLPAGPHPSIWR